MTPTEKAIRGFCGRHADWWPSTTQVQEMLALAQPEQDNTYIYASSLATAIWQKHYMKESPKFALLDTTEGVLTQIDNMTCGLVREKPAQPEQEPVAWWNDTGTHIDLNVSGRGTPLYTHPLQRTWVGLMRGVRVEGDTLVITVKGGNDAARELCGALIEEMNK